MRTTYAFLFLLCIVGQPLQAQKEIYKNHAKAPLDCNECHTCQNPSYKSPCLTLFPEFKRESLTLRRPADEVEALVKIDTLMQYYEASIFKHKLHAEMSAFSTGGCASCHHNNPPGDILPCIDCHEPAAERENLAVIGLKGAYHGQCLGCHKQWSHKTDCEKCHVEKGKEPLPPTSLILEMSQLTEPILPKVIYETEEDNPIVTFHHDAHHNQYGLECIDCHKNETCDRCHDKSENKVAIEKEPHENCQSCHDCDSEDDKTCLKCHDTKEKPPFNHKITGWVLNRYHEKLECLACHSGTRFTKLNKTCTACHKNWKQGSFDHKVTGVVFDENHEENDCADCHLQRKFDQKPACSECHDEITWPERVPGELVK